MSKRRGRRSNVRAEGGVTNLVEFAKDLAQQRVEEGRLLSNLGQALAGVRESVLKVAEARRHETERARAGEDLLREGERLLRNDPSMQRWRKRVGEHLAYYRTYELRPPDTDTEASG